VLALLLLGWLLAGDLFRGFAFAVLGLAILLIVCGVENETGKSFGGALSSRNARRWLIGAAIATVATITVIISPTSLPYELVKVNDPKVNDPKSTQWRLVEGWLVSVDDVSLTILPKGGGLMHIPTGDVAGRFVCDSFRGGVYPLSTSQSGIELFWATISDEEPYSAAECKKA
jgi:hypothetical protein